MAKVTVTEGANSTLPNGTDIEVRTAPDGGLVAPVVIVDPNDNATPVAIATEGTLQEVKTAIDSAVQALENLEGYNDGVETLLSSLQTLATALNGYVDGLELGQSGLQTSLTSISGFIDGLEALVTATNDALTTMNTTLAAQSGYVDGLEALLTSTNALLTTLNGQTDGLEGLATALNGFVDGLETLITATNTSLGTLATKLDTLDGHVDGLETAISATNTALADTNTKLDSLHLDVDGVEGKLDSINDSLGTDVTTPAPAMPAGGSGVRGWVSALWVYLNSIFGVTTGAAVITDANGTVQQYLRGLVKLIAGYLTIDLAKIAGTATDVNSGNSGNGTQRVVIATDQTSFDVSSRTKCATVLVTFTRPNNTTQYTAGDVVVDNTTAILEFDNCSRANDGSGTILGAQLRVGANQTTKGFFQLWLFDTAPATAVDNATNTFSNTELDTLVAVLQFNIQTIAKIAAGSSGNIVFDTGSISRVFKCIGGAKKLYGVLVVQNGYTPTAQETYGIRLFLNQD